MESIKRLESVKFPSESLINIQPDDIDRNLLCTICQEILKIPRECSNCHNNFCKKCIELWMGEKDQTCPFRCGKIKLLQSHRIIIDALRILKFNCKNQLNGCNIILNYDNYIEHAQVCEYNKIKCSNTDCKSSILAKDMESHLDNECEYQVHKCKICSFESMGPVKIPHICGRVAIKQFNELKSEVDNFLIKLTNRIDKIDEKIKNIS
jgi:hypothetical protein